MSALRKKRQLIECNACRGLTTNKNIEKHKVICGQNLPDEVPMIYPRKQLIAIQQKLDNFDSLLPVVVKEYEKDKIVLLNSEAFSYLGIVPRAPCLLWSDSLLSIVLAFPSDQVTLLGIALQQSSNLALLKLKPICDTSIRCVNVLNLRPLVVYKFLRNDSFRQYVEAYISESYVLPQASMTIPYYGVSCEFHVQSSVDDQFSILSIDDNNESIVFKIDSNCSVNILFPMSEVTGKSKTLEDFVGAEEVKDMLLKCLISPIKDGRLPCSVLISGMTGCGKTLLIDILVNELGNSAIKINAQLDFDEQLRYLNHFDSNLVVFVDDFDELKKETESKCIFNLCRFMDNNANVSILLASRSAENIDTSLRRRFAIEIELSVPSMPERVKILSTMLKNEPYISEELIIHIAQRTHGFTGSDLNSLCHLAKLFEKDIVDVIERFDFARKKVRPTGIRGFVLEVPDVKWDDICGNDELKLEIEQALMWPFQYPSAFERLGVEPPSGILLYGPPGCSKTLIARAIASHSGVNFLSVKGPELFSKWVGDSEKAIRDIFRRARQVAPTVLFFDEIDAVAVKRGGDKSNNNVGDRVLAQLLTELDGLEKKSGVLMLAATNRPDTLDGALLRPGRLDRVIYVPLPDEHTRRSILQMEMGKRKVDISNESFASLVEQTVGYSGAELVALSRNAALLAMRENRDAEFVEEMYLWNSLKMIVPRTDKKLLEVYENFKDGFL